MINTNNTRIIFWGVPEFAVPALKKLYENKYNLVGVITMPDKPKGRENTLSPTPVKSAAEKLNLNIFQPIKLKDPEFFEKFKNLKPDLCVLVAYGKIIPDNYLNTPRLGFINIHPSLLPKYRGPSPIQSAILNGEKETGISLMILDKEVDHGPIIAQQTLPIPEDKNFKQIHDELAQMGADLLIKTLPDFLSGKITPKEQDHSAATFTKIITRQDGKINWSQNGEIIINQIRALNPEPGTWSVWNNKIINIGRADFIKKQPAGPGIIRLVDGHIAISTADSWIVPKTIQLEGKKETDINSFLNGHQDFVDSKLE